jgi:hypothetical protein
MYTETISQRMALMNGVAPQTLEIPVLTHYRERTES